MTHVWFNRGSLGGVKMVNRVRVAYFSDDCFENEFQRTRKVRKTNETRITSKT
jgi:hypothetical protein